VYLGLSGNVDEAKQILAKIQEKDSENESAKAAMDALGS